MYTKAEWEKVTIIKDSVHGYINVPKPISKLIVDTDVFQRLKNIEQTGMQVLYPSATHNRFTHSLGVYHLSQKAFEHFRRNVQTDYPEIYRCLEIKFKPSAEENDRITGYEAAWRRWGLLFQLASLLHDCGHSPFSHTLEFVYDLVQGSDSLSSRLIQRCSKQFENDFRAQAAMDERDSVGKPHERMSALFIMTPEEKEKDFAPEIRGGFRDRVRELITSYMRAYQLFDVYELEENVFLDDVEFMARMVIGCRYRLEDADAYLARKFHREEDGFQWKTELQLRNCIIGMLNSKLDVDNLDYVVRDSKYSGYASNGIDLERLLASFTIVNAYQFDTPISLKKDTEFDASVNLDFFRGSYVSAKVSGECVISSKEENLTAKGNIITDTEDFSPYAERKVFRTREEFSAEVTLAAKGEEAIVIKPKDKKLNKAYLNISGYLEGEFQGTILGDTCLGIRQDLREESHRIFFAYKQNSMSVLMSAIDGSNFENKWVYAHHTTTFKNNFLIVYLLERYAEYLVDCEIDAFLCEMLNMLDCSADACTQEKQSGNICGEGEFQKITEFLESSEEPEDDSAYRAMRECEREDIAAEHAEAIYQLLQLYYLTKRLSGRKNIDHEKLKQIISLVQGGLERYKDDRGAFFHERRRKLISQVHAGYGSLGAMEIQCFSKIMTMFKPNKIQGHRFYRTDDQDLLAKYKELYQMLLEDEKLKEKYKEFMINFQYMSARASMKCLWKSYPEYYFYFSNWTEKEKKRLQNLLHRANTPWGGQKGEKQLNYGILSDDVQLPEASLSFWNTLKEQYHLARLVYVEQEIKTKQFLRHETYLKNNERVVRLEDIRLYPNYYHQLDFFYIFFEYEHEEEGKEFTPNRFLTVVKRFIDEGENDRKKTEEKGSRWIERSGHLIIRDNIHGDIVFTPFLKRVVDTKEFQRLRRIKQLATAGQVFPGAVHTRFSHSIGTYHIMKKILNHFKDFFHGLRYETNIDETEEMAILVAALLHDLGHGPYSHAFEETNISLGNMTHEQWTTSIIREERTEIHQVLEAYQKGFSEKVAGYIECETEAKKPDKSQTESDKEVDLKFIFASLVSGQIDADRMDYLLRDSEFSGVTYGQFDLEKVIESLAVSVENSGQYRICVKEEYLDCIEDYFYARYQMHKLIYFHPFKVLSEELFCRILREAQKSVLNDSISAGMIPVSIEQIFTKAHISTEDYCNLDDSVIDGATGIWAESGVKELAFLCRARLERRYYERLEIEDMDQFKYLEKKAEEIFGRRVFEKHFLICKKKKFGIFDRKGSVYILRHNGVIVPLEDISALSKESVHICYVFYSRIMAKEIYSVPDEKLDIFQRVIEKSLSRNHVEIEKKYIFSDKEKISQIKDYFEKFDGKDGQYFVTFKDEFVQEDRYYDTQNLMLQRKDCTLRVRKKQNRNYLTCKYPVQSSSNGIASQTERNEHEEEISSDQLKEHRAEVENLLSKDPSFQDIFEQLREWILIRNKRMNISLERRTDDEEGLSEKYEIAIDCVEYENLNNGKKAKEYQMEIELKSSYEHRINMKLLTDRMENVLDFLEPISESKYQRALKKTGDEQKR